MARIKYGIPYSEPRAMYGLIFAPRFSILVAIVAFKSNKASIRSAFFPNTYLRIDGAAVKSFSVSGSGIVNCQNYAGPFETFLIENHPATQTFTLQSSQFPNVYLRIDAHGVELNANYPEGAGMVNCQYTAGPSEHFRWEIHGDGTWAIASAACPGRYLRIINPGSLGGASGAGTVNIQSFVGPYEKLFISWV